MMHPRRVSQNLLAHVLLLAVVMVWGATFPVVKRALDDASPVLFNTVRLGLATIALLLVNWRQLRTLESRQVVAGLVAGVFLAAGYQLQTIGLSRTTATRSALITGLVVVLVPLLGSIPGILPRSLPRSGLPTAVGALLAFAGVDLLTTVPGTQISSLLSGMNVGDFLTLLCAVAFATHLLTLSKVSHLVASGPLATMQIGFAAGLMALSLPLSGKLHLHLTFTLVMAWLVTAILATAAAFTIQSWAQQHLPATHTAVLLSLEPVFALLTARFYLAERLSQRAMLGAALILAGIAVIELFSSAVAVSSN